MSDFDLELEFVHIADAGGFEDDVWLEVAGVVGGADEGFHLGAEELNIFEGGVEGDEHLKLFFHGLGAGDVFDPEVVEDDVGDLHHFHGVDSFEDRIEQRDLLNYQVDLVDVYSVTDIVGMLDKQKDTRTEKLLGGSCKDERQ